MLIDPDGTRHYLGTGSDTTTTAYQTSDGTHITFVGSKSNGGTLYFNNGTAVTISVINNLLLPSRIKDSNGNYLDIAYKNYQYNFAWRQALMGITDTLGRYLEFNYDDCNNLVSITAPGLGGTSQNPVSETIVRFDYDSINVSNSFSGLTVENAPSSAVPALKHIYFPATQTGYLFSYSAYGMIHTVSLRKP